MSRYALRMAVGVALAFTAISFADKGKDDKEDPDVVAGRKDVVDLAQMIKDGKGARDVQAKVKAIRGKHDDMVNLMRVFKIQEKGGLGIGPKPNPKNGIEKRLIELASVKAKVLAPADVKAESASLLELAYVSLAMAEIAKPYFPGNKNGKNKQAWDGYADDQKTAANGLIQAVKAGNGKAVKASAEKLLDACNDCHKAFR